MFRRRLIISRFFFFNDTATTEIYTLSLHDALPICIMSTADAGLSPDPKNPLNDVSTMNKTMERSEEHTSELQSQSNLVCRLLLEKKKKLDYLRCAMKTHRGAALLSFYCSRRVDFHH